MNPYYLKNASQTDSFLGGDAEIFEGMAIFADTKRWWPL